MEHRAHEEVTMGSNGSGYGRRWKRWIAIYVAVGAIAYLALYLAFFSGDGGGFSY